MPDLKVPDYSVYQEVCPLSQNFEIGPVYADCRIKEMPIVYKNTIDEMAT